MAVVNWRSVAALVLGTGFAAAAAYYWFTVGRRPIVDVDQADELDEAAEQA